MQDRVEMDPAALDSLVELVERKAHELRECLGALQVARSPAAERAAVNRAIGLLERLKIHLRSGRAVVNLSEEWTSPGYRGADAAESDARLKHGALALLDAELHALHAAGVEVVHEFSAMPA